jgi:hypothetical protein
MVYGNETNIKKHQKERSFMKQLRNPVNFLINLIDKAIKMHPFLWMHFYIV